jgi:hypothetical protein
VSCSPYRVPLARLGVAQALLACGRVTINDMQFHLPEQQEAAVGETQPNAASPVDGDGGGGGGGDETAGGIDEALVLHTLRVRGFVTPDGFVESLGRHPAEILAELVAKGEVRHIEKRDMYGLLPPGKERQEALLDSYAGSEQVAGLHVHYERFLELNDVFKQLCTDWQMCNGEQNDHTDAAYDRSCVERLQALNAESRPTLEGFAAVVPRMQRYAERLDAAVAAVVAGEQKKFTGVMCGSFHDIWMELHEDLIVLQRIDRVAEGSF